MDQETLNHLVNASDQHIEDFKKLLAFEIFNKITRLSGFTLRGFAEIYIDMIATSEPLLLSIGTFGAKKGWTNKSYSVKNFMIMLR